MLNCRYIKSLEVNMEDLRTVYNEFALTYEKNRNMFDMSKIIEDLSKNIKKEHKKVLDLGCGAGEPFAKHFLEKGFDVTGVDFSEKMLKQAEKFVPSMKRIHQDMRKVEFNDNNFDIILAIYSIFHLNNEEQMQLLKRIYGWLKKDGILLFTYATKEYTEREEFEGYKNFMGKNLFYAHKTPQYIKEYLLSLGFFEVSFKYREIGGETFLWITVKK